MLISGILSLILYISIYNIHENLSIIYSQLGFREYFAIAYTILVGNIIAYNLYGYVLKKYSAITISIAGFLIPIFVSLYGFIILSEFPPYYFYLSLFTALLGALIFFSSEINT
jgi:drug/metabolite transporter (DMT)-like permease